MVVGNGIGLIFVRGVIKCPSVSEETELQTTLPRGRLESGATAGGNG